MFFPDGTTCFFHYKGFTFADPSMMPASKFYLGAAGSDIKISPGAAGFGERDIVCSSGIAAQCISDRLPSGAVTASSTMKEHIYYMSHFMRDSVVDHFFSFSYNSFYVIIIILYIIFVFVYIFF